MNLSKIRATSTRMPLWLQQAFDRMLSVLGVILGWQLDAVANVAALATVDDNRVPDGTGKFVRTVKDTFHLDKTSAAVVDGITVVATMSATGRWLRDLQPNAVWGSQATWYVDPLTGDDENTGATALLALATFAEARRRIEPIGVLVDTTIYIVSDLAAEDLVGMDAGGKTLTIEGVPTTAYSGTVNTFTDTTAPGVLNDAGWTVADHIGKHVLFTSGVAEGMGCWLLEADFGGAGNARSSIVIDNIYVGWPSVDTPTAGDTFDIETLPTVTLEALLNYDGTLRLGKLTTLNFCIDMSAALNLMGCSLANMNTRNGFSFDCSGILSAVDGAGSCFIQGGAFSNVNSFTNAYVGLLNYVTIDASLAGASLLQLAPNSVIEVAHDMYLFGDFGTRAILMNRSSQLRLIDSLLLGDITGTTRLMDAYDNGVFQTHNNALHTVTEKTIRLVGIGVDVELDTDIPLYEPHFDVRLGMKDNESGAVGSVRVGVKGPLTLGTRYALADLSGSVADEMPSLVTNRSFSRNLHVHLGTAPGGTDTVVVTVMIDGVASTITVTLTGAETEKSDVTHVELIDPGQRVSFRVEKTGGMAANLSISLECG